MHVLAALQPNGLQLASFWPDLLPWADHDSGGLLAREDWRCIRCCTPYESLRHAQRHTTPCCTAARHGMALHVTGMAWHGMTWHCTASHGMVRHGMVSHDRAGQGRAGMSRLCHANAKREAHCSASALQLPSLYAGVCWCHAHVHSPLALRSELPSRRAASFRGHFVLLRASLPVGIRWYAIAARIQRAAAIALQHRCCTTPRLRSY